MTYKIRLSTVPLIESTCFYLLGRRRNLLSCALTPLLNGRMEGKRRV
jgi:hypothetical protein